MASSRTPRHAVDDPGGASELAATAKPAPLVTPRLMFVSENAGAAMRFPHGRKIFMRHAHNPNAGALHYQSSR
jgi:hypothetical protein